MSNTAAIQMIDITKEFSGVKALDEVNFNVEKGEIHALVGENGAGKSTLMNILSGFYPYNSYSGKIIIFGKEKKINSPKDAESAGISIIHQELGLINDISVSENVSLGHLNSKFGIVNWKKVDEKAKKLLNMLNLNIDVRIKIKRLGIGQKQLIEIAKAISLKSKILVLDEPTAALTLNEIEQLFTVLRNLRKNGMTLIYISHRTKEVFDISDRVTVLRDGKLVTTEDTKKTSNDIIITLMVGKRITKMYPTLQVKPGKELLKVDKFHVQDPNIPGKMAVKNINLYVKAGEIVGISGLLGSGRTELVSAIFGAYGKKGAGNIYIDGKLVKINNPRDAIKNGIAFLTEDRKRNGLILNLSVMVNISLASQREISRNGILLNSKEKKLVDRLVKVLRIKTSSLKTRVSYLSGGNQQKIVLAKWLATKAKIFILDEPTRGIDVGAKTEVYQLMKELAENGAGILMISSELQEIIGMSDRVYVLQKGEVTTELDKSKATEEIVMKYATGSF